MASKFDISAAKIAKAVEKLQEGLRALSSPLKAGEGVAEEGNALRGAEAATKARAAQGFGVLAKFKCFVAGTPLLTPDGEKAIELFRRGDLVLSRSESDVDGPVEAKVVEEVFVRVAAVMALVVGGREIGTTAEHPFYVLGKGWRSAKELRAGEWLVSHERMPVRVDYVGETGEVTPVYNLRVADYHTYFVGSGAWGFSVWAHNAEYEVAEEGGKIFLKFNGEAVTTPAGDVVTYAKKEDALAAAAKANAALAPKSAFLSSEEFAKLPKNGTIDPKSIRFSQDSIKGTFKEGGDVGQLAADLKAGKVDPASIPPIRIVEKDGKIYTLDNRRLQAFQEAGVPIRYEKLDKIPATELKKFSTINEGVEIIIRGQK